MRTRFSSRRATSESLYEFAFPRLVLLLSCFSPRNTVKLAFRGTFELLGPFKVGLEFSIRRLVPQLAEAHIGA